MELFYRKKGEAGEPLIILHGLYGSGDNWMSIAQRFSNKYTVYLVDQRNHGRSPHTDEMDYNLLTDDLVHFLDKHKIEKTIIIGHSMGGKTAMWFGFKYPERINRLVIVDIAPKTYEMTAANVKVHRMIISALKSTKPETAISRKEIEERLNSRIPNPQLSRFLLKNIERSNDGIYRWRLNINSIDKNLRNIMDGFSGLNSPVTVPALFVKGELSNYISSEDRSTIETLFPNSETITIPKAGHWLHAQQPEIFINIISEFLM